MRSKADPAILTIFLVSFFVALMGEACSAKELIAYSHLTDGYWQIWSMSPDGKNQRQLTFSEKDKREPAWIKKQKRIAYRDNNGQLFTMDLEGKHEIKILGKYNNINNPAFSDKNSECIFVRFDPTGIDISGIWISDIKGTRPRLLTKTRGLIYQPAINTAGDKIAFVASDDTKMNHHIWVMNENGENLHQVTQGKKLHTLPSFSPDGKQITFTSNRIGNDYEIYLVDIDSREISQLTDNGALDTTSRFSPGGEKIVFVSNRGGNQQIWVMDDDGSKPVPLTQGENESVDPAWVNIE